MYTVIPTVYRAFLTSTVSRIGHRFIPSRSKLNLGIEKSREITEKVYLESLGCMASERFR